MKLSLVMQLAPPTPACFKDREQWAEYLLCCQQNSKPPATPFRHGKYQPAFNFCDDCTLAFSSLMSRQDRCNPSQFRVIPIVKEPAHVSVQ